ncbi:YbaB/EbfC family nucleoid-associated protein [Amycolatopsis sp. NPDC023774]|uniref:YbaB/EbfC family nucleoid-associated protein n=1 Tax=Amycolatopsis sp. NPDC023774 TaxID=3155015 RepID=UPI0033E4D28F
MSDDVDASQRMVDGWARQLQETAARYQAMADRMQGQTVTERTKDGSVTVTVDAKGLLKNLVISESAGGKRMAEVSAQVMQLVQKAQARIPELLRQVASETLGSDATGDKLVEDAKSTFPAPPPEEPSAPPAPVHRFGPEENDPPPPPPAAPPRQQAPPPPSPRRRRAETSDDDDDFGGSILS